MYTIDLREYMYYLYILAYDNIPYFYCLSSTILRISPYLFKRTDPFYFFIFFMDIVSDKSKTIIFIFVFCYAKRGKFEMLRVHQ